MDKRIPAGETTLLKTGNPEDRMPAGEMALLRNGNPDYGMPAGEMALPRTGNLQGQKIRTMRKARGERTPLCSIWPEVRSQRYQQRKDRQGETSLLRIRNPHDWKTWNVWMRLARGKRIPPEGNWKSAHYLFLRRRKHLNHCVARSQGSQHLRIV